MRPVCITTPWLEKQLRTIAINKEKTAQLLKIGNNIEDVAQPWSLLKLSSLKYIADIYTLIIKKQIEKGFLDKMFYVDLFSGSGVNKINSDYYFGSPLIINNLPKKQQFDHLFLNNSKVDNDGTKNSRADALKSRMSQIAQTTYDVQDKDANDYLSDIASELEVSKSHSLIFIDPYSTEFSWNSMEKALSLDADIFFLYQTALVARGLAVSTKPNACIQTFFKDSTHAKEVFDAYEKDGCAAALFDLYKKDIIETRGPKTLIESIRIHGTGYYYDMLFITKRTGGENPWIKNAVLPLKQKIEANDNQKVTGTMDVVAGKQKKLEDF